MTRYAIFILTIFLAGLSASCASSPAGKTAMLELHTRSMERTPGTKQKDGSYRPVLKTVQWAPEKTALVICDMWDRHWCKGAEARVAEMAPEMNQLAETARSLGVQIIHAPSTCVDFYKDTPQRKRAVASAFSSAPVELSKKERWGTAWCWPQDEREPAMPIDDSDMGCDCEKKCEIVPPWTRQIKTIDIREPDAITDNGQEAYNLLSEKGIDNVILMGVHLNMCVLGRPFAIRQMVNVGKNVLLIRDMTDTMYNSQKKPFVNHFRGTDLVVKHVEKYWCPTIESTDFMGGSPFRFREDPLNGKN